MHKIISWFIIMFIGLVPLGAFFDTKQSPKPNMEQFFMKREKRTVNSNTCDNVCEVQFSKISKSAWISSNFLYRPQYLEIDANDLNIPNYLNEQVSHNGKFTIRNTELNSVIGFAFYLLVDVRSNVYNQLGDFYRNNGARKSAFSKDFYVIDTLVDVKISIHKLEDGFYLTSFSAEMPPLPEKDNEQPLPTTITKNDGEYQYNQFQDKLDYLMIQRRDFDKFNYSYLYWVPIFLISLMIILNIWVKCQLN